MLNSREDRSKNGDLPFVMLTVGTSEFLRRQQKSIMDIVPNPHAMAAIATQFSVEPYVPHLTVMNHVDFDKQLVRRPNQSPISPLKNPNERYVRASELGQPHDGARAVDAGALMSAHIEEGCADYLVLPVSVWHEENLTRLYMWRLLESRGLLDLNNFKIMGTDNPPREDIDRGKDFYMQGIRMIMSCVIEDGLTPYEIHQASS